MPMIIGEIRRYLRDNNAIRVSRSVRDLAYRAITAREELAQNTISVPTIEAVAKYIGEDAHEVAAALEAIADPISMFEPVFCDGGDSVFVMDQIGDTSNTDESWLESIALGEAMKKLNERERTIVDLRFYLGKTQMETSAEIGISQAQVSRIEKSALEKIKSQM